jgi:glyoxylase-like metal-dependent hydrolase (beta-lactamase superfamily II)
MMMAELNAQAHFSFKVGGAAVWTLVENRGKGSPAVLIAGEAAVKRYAPQGYESETNAFLVHNGGKVMLVDTGMGGGVMDALAAAGVSPEQVNIILITHTHLDHTAGLTKGGICVFPNADIYISQKEFDWAKNTRNFKPVLDFYAKRIMTFEPAALGAATELGTAAELVPGIRAIATYGHTPGHTMFMLESGGEKLLFWGDLMHAEKVQFPDPSIAVTYDSDPDTAAACRIKVLKYAAENKLPVAGAHLVHPAVGSVTKEGSGYVWSVYEQ